MKYIVANWKANQDQFEVNSFCEQWQDLTKNQTFAPDKEVIVAPTSIFYADLKQRGLNFSVALQDISVFHGGAHTGEVTIENLTGLKPEYTIVGHSERRRDAGETNNIVVSKAINLWRVGITPIICFDLDEMAELSGLLQEVISKPMILAYEPVSAISTSGQAGNLDKDTLSQVMPDFRAAFPGKPIIYGGSVKPENAQEYSDVCDGLLVGSASLTADSFFAIARDF